MADNHANTPTTSGANHDLIVASRVTDTGVYNLQGERIGHVEDISIDRASGQVRYVLMSFGGFLGLGDRIHPLPWSVLTFDTARNGYVIPLDADQLADAPHYTAMELAAYGGQDVDYRDNIMRYYAPFGAMPYW